MSLACTEFHVCVARYTWAKQGDPSRRDTKYIGDTSISINRQVCGGGEQHQLQQHHRFGQNVYLYGPSCERGHLAWLNNQNFNRDGGLMLSHAWHHVINMLSNQEAGLTQQALDSNQQLPLARAPTWAWNSGKPIPGADCFSRYISTLKMRTEMVLETLVFSSLNHLTQLAAQEYFIIQCRHESYKSYNRNICIKHMAKLRASEFGFELVLFNGAFSTALVKIMWKGNFMFMPWINW
jgi:hypothetical protein